MAKQLVMDAKRVVLPSTTLTGEVTAEVITSLGERYVRLVDGVDGESVELSISQWEQLVSAVRVEDVPEPKTPGERLAEVLSMLGSHDMRELKLAELEVAAVALGIKPEVG